MGGGEGGEDGEFYVGPAIAFFYLQEGNNVIATYIQQNWGGRFYDCGMKVDENIYDDFDLDADGVGIPVVPQVSPPSVVLA